MKKLLLTIISLLTSFSLVACSSSIKDDDVVATVNDERITVKDYRSTLRFYEDYMESIYGKEIWDTEVSDGVTYKEEFKNMILQQMIDMQVIYKKAKADNLLPTGVEVEEAVDTLRANIDGDEEFKKKLEEAGIDENFLIKQQEMDLALNKNKKDFDTKNEVNDHEIQKYYDEHKDEFHKNERKVSQIFIPTVNPDMTPYNEKQKEEAKKKAEEALQKINSGEEFSKVAKEYSEDVQTKDLGGDLGYIKKDTTPKEFDEVIFSLEPGQVSDVFETEQGYYIVKLYEVIDEQIPLDNAKEDITNILLEEKYVKFIEESSKEANVEIDEDIVKKVEF